MLRCLLIIKYRNFEKLKRIKTIYLYFYFMKKIFILGVVLATALGMVTSCNEVKKTVTEVDYQVLSKPDEVKKWLDEIKAKAGENAKVMDEVKIYIDRPAVEGFVKKEGEKDEMHIVIVYQDPADKRRVEQIDYSSKYGWDRPEKKEIQVMGIGAENFKLEDQLFDFNQVSYQTINKVIQDAQAKHKDEAKYEYQYVRDVTITIEGIEVMIHGKLKANGVEKSEKYKANLQGNSL